jgi:ketosteroid isomerase-like protein
MENRRVSDDDVELIRRAYRLWRAGDFEGLLALCTDDVEWIPPSYLVGITGPQVGKDALRAGIEAYFESFEEFWPEPEEILDGAEPGTYLALVRTHTKGRGSGAEVTIDVAHLFTIRDHRVVRFQVIPDRQEARQVAGIDPD